MKHVLAVAAFLAALTGAVWAQDYHLGSIEIGNPWARAMPKGAHVAAGYFTITNKGTDPDRLVAVSTDAAKRAEVHEMTMDNGVMRMRPIKDGLKIDPGATVELKPGSFHMMFIEPSKTFAAGDHLKATLKFEKAGTIEVDFAVKAMGDEPTAPKTDQMDHMDHMEHMH